jgi:hypothetical protein
MDQPAEPDEGIELDELNEWTNQISQINGFNWMS